MDHVATLAEVSRATVSRALTGSPAVSPKTRDRVLAAAEQLGYVPNTMARGLAGRASDLVGLLLRDPRNPSYGAMHAHLQAAADAAELQLITSVPHWTDRSGKERDALQRMLGLRVGGLLVATGVIAAEDLAPFLSSVPMVSVGRVEEHPRIHGIGYDEDANGAILAERVLAAGHHEVAVVSPAATVSTAEHRRSRAMVVHLRARGVEPVLLATDAFSDDAARADEVVRLVRQGRITAAMFPTDRRALAFLDLAAAAGVRVPDDVSVTGGDGLTPGLARLGLASLRIPVEEVSRDALALLDRLMRGEQVPVEHDRRPGRFLPGPTLAPRSG